MRLLEVLGEMQACDPDDPDQPPFSGPTGDDFEQREAEDRMRAGGFSNLRDLTLSELSSHPGVVCVHDAVAEARGERIGKLGLCFACQMTVRRDLETLGTQIWMTNMCEKMDDMYATISRIRRDQLRAQQAAGGLSARKAPRKSPKKRR